MTQMFPLKMLKSLESWQSSKKAPVDHLDQGADIQHRRHRSINHHQREAQIQGHHLGRRGTLSGRTRLHIRLERRHHTTRPNTPLNCATRAICIMHPRPLLPTYLMKGHFLSHSPLPQPQVSLAPLQEAQIADHQK
eukprot:TRINITY_DN36423_c0_g1_i1.p2 TRINITY_DN36423_c0_g1~~TRINITY_DN36423_c0_g1_i1.p2  ORF type:complete len:136 (-),score=4.00 TRINITY_DN36423_c0_g1_i1:122-529(-)